MTDNVVSTSTTAKVDDPMGKLPFSRKLAYCCGDFGSHFSWTFVGSFLMYFWTDVLGVTAAFAGTIMLVSRFWDAVNDPIVGTWADRTNTKWGRYRPWMFATIPLAVINVLCFTVFPIQSQAGKNWYGLITFFILVFVFTCMNIPYSAMQSVLTLNTDERSSVAGMRLVGAYIGMLLVNNMTLRLVGAFGGGDQARGFMVTAIVYSIIMIPFHLTCFAGTKELVKPTPKEKAEKVPMSESFKALKGNAPVWILSFGFLTYGLYNHGRGTVAMYYFTYNAGNTALFATYSLFNVGALLLGALIMPRIAHRVSNKAHAARAGYAVAGVTLLVMGFLDTSGGIGLFFALQAIASVAQGMATSCIYGMIPDCTEYTQHRYGLRAAGFISSLTSFAMKTGMGIGTASVGWVLAATGYVAGQQQNPASLSAINGIFTFVPAAFAIVIAILLCFYKIDRDSYNRMVKEMGLDKQSEA